MDRPAKPASVLLAVCKILYFLLPMLVVWLSVSLMSMHMKYHDIGINPGANNGFLLLIVTPVLSIILYIAAAASLRLSDTIFISPWAGIVVGSAVVVGLGLAAFLLKVMLDLDDAGGQAGSLVQFLDYYLQQIGVRASSL